MVESKKTKAVIRHPVNPFLGQLNVSPSKGLTVQTLGKDKENQIVNIQTGEITEIGMIARRRVERAEFIKFYTRDLGWMLELNTAGMAVLRVLLQIIQDEPSKDEISALQPIFKRYGWKSSSAYRQRGLANLVEAGLLARSEITGNYWINPAYVFNGDRVRLFKEYKVEQMSLRPPALDSGQLPNADIFEED